MGKKKKKIESSSIEAQSPRKRGRPRKIVEERGEEQETAQKQQEVAGTDFKKAKTGDEGKGDKEKKLEEIVVGPSSNSKQEEKEECKVEDKTSKQEGPRRSRAKRKNKPRKTS